MMVVNYAVGAETLWIQLWFYTETAKYAPTVGTLSMSLHGKEL